MPCVRWDPRSITGKSQQAMNIQYALITLLGRCWKTSKRRLKEELHLYARIQLRLDKLEVHLTYMLYGYQEAMDKEAVNAHSTNRLSLRAGCGCARTGRPHRWRPAPNARLRVSAFGCLC
jgi:hypothetical protein